LKNRNNSIKFLIFSFEDDSKEEKSALLKLSVRLRVLGIEVKWFGTIMLKEEVLEMIDSKMKELSDDDSLFILFNAHGVSQPIVRGTPTGLEGKYFEGIKCAKGTYLVDKDLNILYKKYKCKKSLLFFMSNGCNNESFFVNLQGSYFPKSFVADYHKGNRIPEILSRRTPRYSKSNITFISKEYMGQLQILEGSDLVICGLSISKETGSGSSDDLFSKLAYNLNKRHYVLFNEFMLDFFPVNDHIQYTVLNSEKFNAKLGMLNFLIHQITNKKLK